MSIPTKLIKLSHARDYLRQHFAIDAGLDTMDAIPLGSKRKDVDPETQIALREHMQRCRDNAHWEISGMIGGAKITVWKERSDGGLEPAGANWAQKTFDAKGTGSDVLYFDKNEWDSLLSQVASAHSQRYLMRLRPQETPDGPVDFPQACVDISLITWSDFPPRELNVLEHHAQQAAEDEYWTWPEALAWVGSREIKHIAILRHYMQKWLNAALSEPVIGLAAQYYVARQYCADPRKDEATLFRSIEHGIVSTIGRHGLSGPAEPLAKELWRGGKIVYSRGVAMLVSRVDPMAPWAMDIAVHRESLAAKFQPRSIVLTELGDIVPPNRQLNHAKIIEQAASMLTARPGISKGSAAASIVADLPRNPKTGKPRDTRHIERIIAHLWEGGL